MKKIAKKTDFFSSKLILSGIGVILISINAFAFNYKAYRAQTAPVSMVSVMKFVGKEQAGH